MTGFAIEALASSHTPRPLPDFLHEAFSVHGRLLADELYRRGLQLRLAGDIDREASVIDRVAYAFASSASSADTAPRCDDDVAVVDAIASLEDHMLGWGAPSAFPPTASAYGSLYSVFGALRAAVFDHIPDVAPADASPDVEPPSRFRIDVAPFGRVIALEAELRVDDGQMRHRGTFVVRRVGSDQPVLTIPAKTITGYAKRGSPIGILATLYGTPDQPVVPCPAADGPKAAAVIAAQLQGHVIRRPARKPSGDEPEVSAFQLTRSGREHWLASAATSDEWPHEFMSITGEGHDEVLIDPYTGRIESGEILLEDGSRAAWVDLQCLPCAADAGDSGRLRLADVALVGVDGKPAVHGSGVAPSL